MDNLDFKKQNAATIVEGNVPEEVLVGEVGKIFSDIITAMKECSIEKLRNETERARIRAFLTVALDRIRSDHEIITGFMQSSFNERMKLYKSVEEIQQKGLACNDKDMVKLALDFKLSVYMKDPMVGVDKALSNGAHNE